MDVTSEEIVNVSRSTCLFLLLLLGGLVEASGPRYYLMYRRVNRKLSGQVLDFTRNHGSDNRLYFPSLCQKRDMYVYLPPCFDPQKKYPLVFWLHGFAQDEMSFLEYVIQPLDRAMACGELPPAIICAPDGSVRGRACYFAAGTFWMDTPVGGNHEQFLMKDVWDFLHENFPIRPEREAHVLAGVSMGGGTAFAKGIKFQERIGVVIGIFPPLNTRWVGCDGRYFANFDPDCWGWRTDFSRGCEVIGRFYGIFNVRMKNARNPLYGRNHPNIVELVASENPIELLDSYNLKEGTLSMLVCYGRRDQFNMDAQVESFLYVAKQKGLTVDVVYDPKGRHDARTALSFVPDVVRWLRPKLAPYAP